MAQYENAIIGKARALYGKMLSPTQYEELLRRQSVQEVAAYLKEKTAYAGALEEVHESTVHRGQLENMLRKDVFYQYARLAHFLRGDRGIAFYVVMDVEIELILSCLRDLISDRPDEYIANLPEFISPFISFEVLDLVHLKSVTQLVELLQHTAYGPVLAECARIHPQMENQLDYTAFELMLRTFYFEKLLAGARQSFRGKDRALLEELVNIRAESLNLHMIYRMKTYYGASPEQIRHMLLPYVGATPELNAKMPPIYLCRLSRKTLEALIEAKDSEAFGALLAKTPYGWASGETGFIEGVTSRQRRRCYSHALRFSTEPQAVFAAFMLLRGIEVENLVRIIEGVRYQMPPEKIEKLLCRA